MANLTSVWGTPANVHIKILIVEFKVHGAERIEEKLQTAYFSVHNQPPA